MGILDFARELNNNNKYLISTKSYSYLYFLALRYYYSVEFSNKITNNLFLGNYIDSANLSFLKNNNIKVIINCSKDLPFYVDTNIVPYLYRLPVNDDLRDESLFIMYQYLPNIIKTIKTHIDMGHNIYIHCHAGMQRSATVIAGYLMTYNKLSIDDAIKYIRERRKIAFIPMINFRKSLEKYYADLG
jgi:hypothetical protein